MMTIRIVKKIEKLWSDSMDIKIEIILTPDEFQELKRKCDDARESIIANSKNFGIKCDGLLEACTPERVLERFKESFESEDTLDDIIRDLIYESLR